LVHSSKPVNHGEKGEKGELVIITGVGGKKNEKGHLGNRTWFKMKKTNANPLPRHQKKNLIWKLLEKASWSNLDAKGDERVATEKGVRKKGGRQRVASKRGGATENNCSGERGTKQELFSARTAREQKIKSKTQGGGLTPLSAQLGSN